jgi:diguanylate cyclase (GGDEF)-like protein/PAS domain S-box-containing protein
MTPANQRAGTILVVEDSKSNIDLLLAMLDDYDIIPAPCAEEAFSILAEQPVDLVLLDIMLPRINGFEVCEQLKANPRTHDIPIIFITALEDEKSIEKAYTLGAYDYVTKPFRPRELRARVQTQLTLYRQYQKLTQKNLELSQAEQNLKASNLRYQSALDTTRDGFWVVEPDGRIVEVNDAYCQMSGYSREELLTKSIADLDAVETPKETIRHIAKVKQQGNDVFETYHRHKNKIVWAVEISASYSTVQGGRIFAFLRDIRERKQNEEISLLRQKLAQSMSDHNLDELLRTVLDNAERLTNSKIAFFHFVDKDQETLSFQTWSTHTTQKMCRVKETLAHQKIGKTGIWADCLKQRRLVIHNHSDQMPDGKALPAGHAELKRELTVPILRENRIVAMIGIGNKPIDYNEQDQKLMYQVANIAYDFVERKQAEQRIAFMAFNDVLTGLPNRQLLSDRLRQAISIARRCEQLLAICYLDLDGFKPINDRYGHHFGDRLLVKLAERLQEDLREGDTLARLGGDEFVLLLNGLTTIYDGEQIIHRIIASIKQPFDIEGQRILISGSIGATFYPTDDEDADTLLRHADQAMYKAKSAGKSGYWLFDCVNEQQIRNRRKELHQFGQSLRNQQFVLYYQPRVDLGSGDITSAEALVRWRHPQQGLLLPINFLPLIAGTPLEITLSEWVLKTALEQHMQWRAQGLRLPISVNISPHHIQLKGFVSFIENLLAKYPKDIAGNLELEVLETASIGDTSLMAETMNRCAELGIHFSMDDFGTGYASLTYFHRLPIDILKIDQHFVRNMLDDERDLDIVEGVLRLAYGLKRPVVAEGVESIELGMMLLQLGCRYAQGFSIAKPMPSEQIIDWLANWKKTNIWHRLLLESKELSTNHDLNASIFSHRFWLNNIIQYIESEEIDTLPKVDEQQCQFERWYRGIGLIRYGTHPSYPAIPPQHSSVHEKAAALVALVKQGNKKQALIELPALREIGNELISVLKQLADPCH